MLQGTLKLLGAAVHANKLPGVEIWSIFSFMIRCRQLKDVIILAQHASTLADQQPPLHLPLPILATLSDSLNISDETIKQLWMILKEEIWAMPTISEIQEKEMTALVDHGWKRELTWLNIFPPTHRCMTHGCKANQRSALLKKCVPKQTVVFCFPTVQPAYAISLYCPDCNTTYHNNYAVRGGTRFYYDSKPKYLQVGEHHYVEDKVVSLWVTLMVLGSFSATNCSKSYDVALSCLEISHPDWLAHGWQFSLRLTVEHIWFAFNLDRLMEQHCIAGRGPLVLPHTGDQKVRLHQLMVERNRHIAEFGQEEVIRHVCDRCFRVFEKVDPKTGLVKTMHVHPLVGDGVSIGHLCCCVHACNRDLTSTKDRFCSAHAYLNEKCAVEKCSNPVEPRRKACKDHRHLEKKKDDHKNSFFNFTRRLQRFQPNLAGIDDGEVGEGDLDIDENDEEFLIGQKDDGSPGEKVEIRHVQKPGFVGVGDEEAARLALPCEAAKSDSGNRRIKAHFSRRRTHNEQTLVRPCGVVYARAPFFGAEAVSNVLTMTQTACSVPDALPLTHFVYDCSCLALEQIQANKEKWSWWKDVQLVVDVWHFANKHKTTHDFCQKHCNPAKFEELVDEKTKKWFFNTSIAEQVNVWLGSYQSMCREMTAVQYNFFLDEMVRLRNQMVLARLQEQGRNPRFL